MIYYEYDKPVRCFVTPWRRLSASLGDDTSVARPGKSDCTQKSNRQKLKFILRVITVSNQKSTMYKNRSVSGTRIRF